MTQRTNTLTPWFNAKKHKPARVGWYDFYDSLWGNVYRLHWDGKNWSITEGLNFEIYVGDKWRGLMEPK